MPEPMSSVEIEDVLSSIRKLVSEDLRPQARIAAARVNSRLVLTPSHRVPTAILKSVPTGGEAPDERADQPAPADDRPGLGPLAGALSATAEAEPDEERDVTRIEGAVFQSRLAVSRIENLTDAFPARAPEQSLLGPAPEPAAPIYTTPLVLERQIVPEVPPSTPPRDPDEEARWSDQAEAEVIAELSVQTATAPEDHRDEAADEDGQGTLFSEELRYDEAVLRDLVRDLIREELQGSLGERITRNVRKLVRAEVARALSLHDFD